VTTGLNAVRLSFMKDLTGAAKQEIRRAKVRARSDQEYI
jgi:hypothetical protein